MRELLPDLPPENIVAEPAKRDTAAAVALATAWVGGWTMVSLRRLNGIVARRARPAFDRGLFPAIARVQLFGLTADFVRGALLTLVALLVFGPIVQASIVEWGMDARISRA